MSKAIELTGLKFGKWKVLHRSEIQKAWGTHWRCLCECGITRDVDSSDLRDGKSTSCGCAKIATQTIHGNSKTGSMSSEYKTWIAMRSRCNCKSNTEYNHYGGRGIKVCKRWDNFENFLADMGLKPSRKHSIERIKNDGNYEPSNCRWATQNEQNRNKRNNRLITCFGESKTITDWSSQVGISAVTIHYRIKRGWLAELAVFTPLRS